MSPEKDILPFVYMGAVGDGADDVSVDEKVLSQGFLKAKAPFLLDLANPRRAV